MTHIPDHLQGDSPLARWWVALEGVRAEIYQETAKTRVHNHRLRWVAKLLGVCLEKIEEERRS